MENKYSNPHGVKFQENLPEERGAISLKEFISPIVLLYFKEPKNAFKSYAVQKTDLTEYLLKQEFFRNEIESRIAPIHTVGLTTKALSDALGDIGQYDVHAALTDLQENGLLKNNGTGIQSGMMLTQTGIQEANRLHPRNSLGGNWL